LEQGDRGAETGTNGMVALSEDGAVSAGIARFLPAGLSLLVVSLRFLTSRPSFLDCLVVPPSSELLLLLGGFLVAGAFPPLSSRSFLRSDVLFLPGPDGAVLTVIPGSPASDSTVLSNDTHRFFFSFSGPPFDAFGGPFWLRRGSLSPFVTRPASSTFVVADEPMIGLAAVLARFELFIWKPRPARFLFDEETREEER
jgi:hypothetical protein